MSTQLSETLLLDFLNSHRFDPSGSDPLATPGTARDWLQSHGVTATLTTSELDELRNWRGALREVLLAHAGHREMAKAAPRLAELADRRSLAAVVTPTAGVAVSPAQQDGLEQFVSSLLVIAVNATVSGSWIRFRACGNAECQAAFIDHTRNSSRAYCSKRCSTLVHVRAHRQRQQFLDAGE